MNVLLLTRLIPPLMQIPVTAFCFYLSSFHFQFIVSLVFIVASFSHRYPLGMFLFGVYFMEMPFIAAQFFFRFNEVKLTNKTCIYVRLYNLMF